MADDDLDPPGRPGSEPAAPEQLDWPPPRERAAGRVRLIGVLGVAVTVLLVVAIGLGSDRGDDSTPPPVRPTAPTPTPPRPTSSPTVDGPRVVRDGPPVRPGAPPGSTVWALGQQTLYSLDLVTGRAVAQPVPARGSNGGDTLVALQEGVLVPDGSGGYRHGTGAGAVLEPTELTSFRAPGPGRDVWVDGGDTTSLELTGLGGEVAATIEAGAADAVFPGGRVVLSEAGRVWLVDERGAEQIARGRLAAAHWPQLLVVECTETRECRGEVRDLEDSTSQPVAAGVPLTRSMDLSGDGRWALVGRVENFTLTSELVDLSTGEVVAEPDGLSTSQVWTGSTAWLPDSSAMVYARAGATLSLLSTDGTTTDLGLPADSFRSVIVGP